MVMVVCVVVTGGCLHLKIKFPPYAFVVCDNTKVGARIVLLMYQFVDRVQDTRDAVEQLATTG